MPLTHIAHQHGLLLERVPALSVRLAGVDGVFVVQAFADGEALDEFVAHCKPLVRLLVYWIIGVIGEIEDWDVSNQSMVTRHILTYSGSPSSNNPSLNQSLSVQGQYSATSIPRA